MDRYAAIKASTAILVRLVLGVFVLSCKDSTTAPPFTDARGLWLVVRGQGLAAEIYAMRPDGTEYRQLTHNTVIDGDPDWSPDGSKIAFVSMLDEAPGRPRRPEIYVMNADGSGLHRLVATETAWYPRWSPDGTRISFQALDPAVDRFRAHAINADGSNLKVLGSHAGDTFRPEWSPDGTKLLFVSNRCPRCWGTAYVMSADGSSELQLTDDSHCATNVSIAKWSPDGSRIAYSCDTDPSGYFIMNSDGTGSVRLTSSNDYGGMYGLVWSPDGKQLAFSSTRGSTILTTVYHLNLIDATGGPATELTTTDVIDFVNDWGGAR